MKAFAQRRARYHDAGVQMISELRGKIEQEDLDDNIDSGQK